MIVRTVSEIVFACHSAACRPPNSGGTGGSSSSGGSKSAGGGAWKGNTKAYPNGRKGKVTGTGRNVQATLFEKPGVSKYANAKVDQRVFDSPRKAKNWLDKVAGVSDKDFTPGGSR